MTNQSLRERFQLSERKSAAVTGKIDVRGETAALEYPKAAPALLKVAEAGAVYSGENTDKHGLTRTKSEPPSSGVRAGPCASVSLAVAFPAVCAANGALSLLNLCIHLIGRQMDAQADAFEKEGGFTERLYRIRSERRKQA